MLWLMEPWITVGELSVWTRTQISPDDPFALLVLEAATILVNSATGYAGTEDEFTVATAPGMLKIIVGQVAKRNYLNPDQVVREGNVGPLGGDTYAQAYAAGMTLTEEERAEIARIAREAVEGGGRKGGLSVIGYSVAHNSVGRRGTFLPDSSGSDWMIPMED